MSTGSLRLALLAGVFVLVPAPLSAQPAAEIAVSAHSMLDIPIEDIAASLGGCAVLDKNLPELRGHAMYGFFKSMTLNQIAAMSHGKITQAMLTQTQADLSALPVKAAVLPHMDAGVADAAPGQSQAALGGNYPK